MFKKSQIAVLALNCLFAVFATSCVADEVNWQRVGQAVSRSDNYANALRQASSQIPPQYASIRSQMMLEAQRLQTFVTTVKQNVQVVQQNPNNSQSLNWAIQYAREASRSAERIESLARELRRAADRADDNQWEQNAREIKRAADVVDDDMSRVRRELD